MSTEIGTETLAAPLTILGRELRTSNDVAARTIPPFWQAFSEAGSIGAIPQRLSDDIYAVYTNFAHAGLDNTGTYSLVIGGLVPAGTAQHAGFTVVTVPASVRCVFPVPAARPDLVGAAWQEIWARTDLAQTYIADFERYTPDGRITISIGVQPDSATIGAHERA